MNHKTVVFNEAKMNFDGNLDFSVLSSEVVTYSDTTPDQFLERVADAEILVTKEMPVEDNPLYTLDNVILTPHMGWKGLETRQRLLSILKGNIDGFINGKPVNVVS